MWQFERPHLPRLVRAHSLLAAPNEARAAHGMHPKHSVDVHSVRGVVEVIGLLSAFADFSIRDFYQELFNGAQSC